MADIECEHCGGTEFYKEAGFFFCQSCQVQSQEVRDYVYDDLVEDVRTKATKLTKEKPKKEDNKITSWECYNYILLGLTGELISLGADKTLKTVVKHLWLVYLEKLQVFKRGKDTLPKLQPTGSQKDGQIVYGVPVKKRKRRHSSSSGSKSVESSVQHERIKKKRAFAKAQYEDFSQSQADSSLHNETLASLKSSDKSSLTFKPIRYNIFAVREMKRMKKSKIHWYKHRTDFEHTMTCHRLTYKNFSHKYCLSPYILSLNKLYSILYLGLLIIKDKIQLGDMLRFIKEGKLSFNTYSHFFPDEFSDKDLNFHNFKKPSIFGNSALRSLTSKMSLFLGVDYYVSRPGLITLSDRYCKELNLPEEIAKIVKNAILATNLKMSYLKRSTKVPNYEGRVLSIIIFVVKLFFSLDDVTEFHLGNYSDILNQSKSINSKKFNIVEWLKYIEYRSVVMAQHHFPTNFSNGGVNPSLAINIFALKEFPPEAKPYSKKEKYKRFLETLKNEMKSEFVYYPTTLTPFLDYSKMFLRNDNLNMLQKNFALDSIDHILKPKQFLSAINKKIQIVHGGANENWIPEKISCAKEELARQKRNRRKRITVALTLKKSTNLQKQKPSCSQTMKENFLRSNQWRFQKFWERLEKNPVPNLDGYRIKNEFKRRFKHFDRHYLGFEGFWMLTKLRVWSMSQADCRDFLKKFPSNFLLVFKECQRICQQNQQELLVEYQFTELYLAYFFVNKKAKNKRVVGFLNAFSNLW